MSRTIASVLTVLAAFGLASAGWLPEERLTLRPDTADFTSANNARCVASDRAGNIHVAWYGKYGRQSQVWYKRLDALTGRWSENAVISSEPQGASNPSVAVDDSGDAHVVWQVVTAQADSVLRYRRRDANSGTWGPIETVARGTYVRLPSIAARQDSIVAVWGQQWRPQYQGVFSAVRTPGGWSQPEMVSDSSSRDQEQASAGIDATGLVSVLWRNASAGLIVLRQRDAAGWARPETVYRGACAAPCLWVERDGTVHCIWTAQFSGQDRQVYRQKRGGVWRDTVMLPVVSAGQEPASLTADGVGQLHAVWVAKDTLCYTSANRSGRAWSVPVTIGSGLYKRWNPSLCAGRDGELQIVWTDSRNNPYLYPDIYCRRFEPLRDIGIVGMEPVPPTIDSGTTVQFAVVLANCGPNSETNVPVWLQVDTILSFRRATTIEPRATCRIEMDSWVATVPGEYPFRCSVFVAGDERPQNNVVRDRYFVRLRDVALDSILSPVGSLPLDTVKPRVIVRNRGNVQAEVRAGFRILRSGQVVYSCDTSALVQAGAVRQLVFAPWFGEVGAYTAACSVGCTGDIHPENDTGSTRFELFYRDVGVEEVIWPSAQVDSGATGVPVALVRNLGSTTEWYKAFLAIGSDHRDSLEVRFLAPGRSDTLRFAGWTAKMRGALPVVCSLWCVGDMNTHNNVVTRAVFVRVLDVAAESIISPVGLIPADSVRPVVRLRNQGNTTVKFRCRLFIKSDSLGIVYSDSADAALAPDSSADVAFSVWREASGRYRSFCFSGLTGDMRPENDTARSVFTLYRPEVQATRLVVPAAVIDSSWYGRPVVEFRNPSPLAVSCQCSLYIGPYYARAETIAGILPGKTRQHSFSEYYYAIQRGWQPVLCSILAVTESVLGHGFGSDNRCLRKLECSLFVRVRDVSVESILSPSGNAGSGSIVPRVRIRNRGNVAGSPWCWFTIADSASVRYQDSLFVVIAPESDSVLEFRPWAANGGRYIARAWACLDSDAVRTNDTASAGFRVVRMDAAAQRIVQPLGTMRPGGVRPSVVVANLGEDETDIRATFLIADSALVYGDTVRLLRVRPSRETTAVFREWSALAGKYAVRAVVDVAGDEDPGNDFCSTTVRVELPRLWAQLQDVPAGYAGKPVRDGGCLVSLRDGLLCLKGGNSDECYRYWVNSDSWRAVSPVLSGSSGRKVKSGAALCFDGTGRVYALRGNRTREFLAYDLAKDSWSFLSELPEATRLLKYGAGLAFLAGDSSRVCFVKGSGTWDFLAYWVKQNQWHARRRLPLGPSGRPARRGTCLATISGRVFCLKGGTNEFYEYFPKGDSWVQRADLPAVGASGMSRKVREGASLCAGQSGCLYAFKGRSAEFWRYDIASDTWVQLDDIPASEGSRRAGRGAALAFLSGRVYAMRGAGTREFWRYEPDARAECGSRDESPSAGVVRTSSKQKVEVLRASARVYDICGRTVRCEVSEGRVSGITVPGVYFIEAEAGRPCRKVLVVR